MDFSTLELTREQEKFVDEYMFQWGAWVRSGRLDKREVNMIARLMMSVEPSEAGEIMCADDVGYMISQIIDQFFVKNDEQMRFIVFSYYVNKSTVNFIATKLRKQVGAIEMQPYNGKSNIRVPSHLTVRRKVEKQLYLAKAIIHELLVIGFVLLRNGKENTRNIKIGY
ncbi:Phage antitermination protein Q [Phocoenobacter uteri]|uniref:Phage antitermination protein Q n=1 Tax=Phocoenobacter uteri TaxID=146806 RepID=A0A379CA21_9PAST|nr:antiterminator Q family protein [Phocoenobacter uteri]MDG6880962.1 antitermination protein [Phocoenobacter uteri]SUB58978.1 Phage antitermination protein Q [Phocoenobacter uteri]